MKTISINPRTCTQCGICIEICPTGLIIQSNEGIPVMPDEVGNFCSKCGNCEAFCPESAISPVFDTKHADTPKENIADIMPGQLGTYMQQRRSIRNYKNRKVDRALIEEMLDIVRYSPSGMNNQPVRWLVVHDPEKVRKLTRLTMDWMRDIRDGDNMHPLKPMVPALIAAYEAGKDPICRGAPHVAIAYAAEANPMAFTDSIIALSWFELAAPAFGLGACWAGFLKIAASEYQPLIQELDLPNGHVLQYSMMFGYPKYKEQNIPGREPSRITWK
ncbi:nitroreductase family protein [Methanolobus halotolerans]|uniref:Nitroreductase n=1 Tax=Methanolobus halotolerans TaxID=2052935 RepID=A0A4E0Q935_9EURY|nr:nitroreductase family protein [Methanolobus halotolerans]TGC08508.1 nitroreductase [Methanolobus halotolerans]